jgi:hypothetical protein
MVRPLVSHIALCQPVQFLVNDRQEFAERALLPSLQACSS